MYGHIHHIANREWHEVNAIYAVGQLPNEKDAQRR
jgi:hypothetical protein